MSSGRQRTEDRGQKFCRGVAAAIQQPARSADNNLSSVFCPPSSERQQPARSADNNLSSIFCPPSSEHQQPARSADNNLSSVLCPLSSEKGFTLIELIVVIILIVVMMGLFLNRVTYYQEQAEKAAMEQVIGAIQSALTMQYGQIMTRGKPSDMAALAQDNPMNWLQKKPHNYSGEFYDPTPLAVASGNWVFDLKSRDLIYVLHGADYFKPGADGKKWIRFHIAVNYEAPRLPSLQGAPTELTGMTFEPVEPYSWF